MTPEETYRYVTSMLKVTETVKADMLGKLPSLGLSAEEIARLTDAIEHAIAVEVLTKLGEKLRSNATSKWLGAGNDWAWAYDHPCRDCGRPIAAHPTDTCEAWA